jgi:hypothetical protein
MFSHTRAAALLHGESQAATKRKRETRKQRKQLICIPLNPSMEVVCCRDVELAVKVHSVMCKVTEHVVTTGADAARGKARCHYSLPTTPNPPSCVKGVLLGESVSTKTKEINKSVSAVTGGL